MKVLVSAYACEPRKGSEPGAGWNWVLAAARRHEVWVLTRANNRPSIEQSLGVAKRPSLTFVYLDLPAWARFWKRGSRGVHLYYVVWQLLASRAARRLHRRERFDLVHHVTFANAWLPALAFVRDAPFVLGPVGGGLRVPLRLYRALGVRGAIREVVLVATRWLSRGNPLTRAGWRRADVILVQNEETRAALPSRYRGKAILRPNATIGEEFAGETCSRRHELTAVYAGRLTPWKGVSLAIHALTLVPSWRLLVVGSGADERRLRRLVARSDLSDRVSFIRWLPQRELWQTLASCHALILPSLREDASFSSAEAQALGVRVVAFARGGPAALARFPGASFELVPLRSREDCIRGLAGALETVGRTAPPTSIPDFGPAGVARKLDLVYRAAVVSGGHPTAGVAA